MQYVVQRYGYMSPGDKLEPSEAIPQHFLTPLVRSSEKEKNKCRTKRLTYSKISQVQLPKSLIPTICSLQSQTVTRIWEISMHPIRMLFSLGTHTPNVLGQRWPQWQDSVLPVPMICLSALLDMVKYSLNVIPQAGLHRILHSSFSRLSITRASF